MKNLSEALEKIEPKTIVGDNDFISREAYEKILAVARELAKNIRCYCDGEFYGEQRPCDQCIITNKCLKILESNG